MTDLWTCPDCAFSFDATHKNSDGTYSCPNCFEEKARAEIERLRKEHDDLLTKALGVEAERDIARDEIERLRVALKPFADLAQEFCCDERSPREVVTHAVVHAGDLQAAREALSSGKDAGK